MNPDTCIIVAGSSITTDTSWPTWATWIEKRYQPQKIINVSTKGMGNELILIKAVQAAQQCQHPLIVVQLTSVDKWDWYVENTNLTSQLNQEKHPIIRLASDDAHGFWSTGSHFPLWKQHYSEHYFSLEHTMFQTLLLIQWFQLLCQQQGWQYYVLFDSPLLSVTEKQLNQGLLSDKECWAQTLIQNNLCQVLANLINFTDIYTPGIIGYAQINQLPWYSQRFKGHPGSLTHYQFTKNIMAPILDRFLVPQVNFETFEHEAIKFQTLAELD
jgi:hypothetical protein